MVALLLMIAVLISVYIGTLYMLRIIDLRGWIAHCYALIVLFAIVCANIDNAKQEYAHLKSDGTMTAFAYAIKKWFTSLLFFPVQLLSAIDVVKTMRFKRINDRRLDYASKVSRKVSEKIGYTYKCA